MKRVVRAINKILFYGFLVFGVALLFFDISSENAMIFSFCSFLASWLLFLFLKRKGVVNLDFYLLLINIGLWLNVLGEWGAYYTGLFGYDKFLHFAVGFLIAVITYSYFSKRLKPDKLAIFFSVLGMLCIWEIYEYILFAYFGYPAMGVMVNGEFIQSPLDDTMFDFIFGSIGSIVYLIFKKEDVSGKIKGIGRRLR